MSAIWGIIGRSGNNVESLFKDMTDITKKYRIDRTDCSSVGNAYFACGHAHITKEAFHDVSPVYDKKQGILFAADAFLTNRDELTAELSQTDAISDPEEAGDAFLCYTAFLTFGRDFVKHIKGSFSVAVYDINANKLSLYADPMARRYLAYHIGDGSVCFSTTYDPIKKCMGKVELNEQGIVEYYTSVTPRTFRSPDLTVYKDIYHVNCAQVVDIDVASGKKTQKTYYEVGKGCKTFKNISDEECKKMFVGTYRKCVKSILRSSGETAVLLSGGLDSSSVAALAAEELAKEGKNLYSYTMLPASGYKYTNSRTISENEKPHVEAQKEKHPNIITNYVTGDDGCIFTRLDEYTDLFECPVKVSNIDNIIRMVKEADKANCKLIMGGANGNASVSYGSIMLLLSHHLLRFRFVKAYKALGEFCRARHIPRKYMVKYYLENAVNYFTSYFKFRLYGLVKKEYSKKYNLLKRERKELHAYGTDIFSTKRQRRAFIYNRYFFQHIGFYDTYVSLLYGVYTVDPTEMVDMIEFCLKIPIEYQVKGDIERRTIREYMKEYLPECVYSNRVGRGIQCADIDYRVNRDWDDVKEGIRNDLSNPLLKRYLDNEEIRSLQKLTEESDDPISRMDVLRLYAISSLGSFLNKQ